MLLLIDIGNTSTTCGIFTGKAIQSVHYIDTNNFPSYLLKLLRNKSSIPISDIVFSCVVPKIGLKLRKTATNVLGKAYVWELGRNLAAPIKHNYKHIEKLGSDRLINIYGAVRLYKPPFLILDFGTALTCDYVSKNGVFQGGLIIPGPEIALKALTEKAALLPKLPFPAVYRSLFGTDTKGGMKAGILQGYGAMTDGLVGRFKSKYGSKLSVIATGGLAKTISGYASSINKVDPLLSLKSLCLAFINSRQCGEHCHCPS